VKFTVFWTRFAEEKLDKLFFHFNAKADAKIVQSMINEIIDKSITLEKHPRIGQIESLLSERKVQFRYLIHKNNKLIYWINDSQKRIEIINLFDSRQNPNLLAEQAER